MYLIDMETIKKCFIYFNCCLEKNAAIVFLLYDDFTNQQKYV